MFAVVIHSVKLRVARWCCKPINYGKVLLYIVVRIRQCQIRSKCIAKYSSKQIFIELNMSHISKILILGLILTSVAWDSSKTSVKVVLGGEWFSVHYHR